MTEPLTERQRWVRRLARNGGVMTGTAILLLLVAAALLAGAVGAVAWWQFTVLTHIAFRLMLDGAPRPALESQIRRLAEDVMPTLRDKGTA